MEKSATAVKRSRLNLTGGPVEFSIDYDMVRSLAKSILTQRLLLLML